MYKRFTKFIRTFEFMLHFPPSMHPLQINQAIIIILVIKKISHIAGNNKGVTNYKRS